MTKTTMNNQENNNQATMDINALANAIYNELVSVDNTKFIGLSGDKHTLFTRFDLSFCTENPVTFKAMLLSEEYAFVYDTISDRISKLYKRNIDLQNTLDEHIKKAKNIVAGEYTVKKRVNGIDRTFTLTELKNDITNKMDNNRKAINELEMKQASLETILIRCENFRNSYSLTDSENIVARLMRYDFMNSKSLDIKNSFVELASACQEYNRKALKKLDTKESYMNMKKCFNELACMFKVTKDTKGEFLNVKTFSFNQDEMLILASTIFSSGSIGVVEKDGHAYYTIASDGKLNILKNIVKIIIMKLQGVKITTENI